MERAAEKSVLHYNLRRRHEEYAPGQKVWRKNYVLADAFKHFNANLAPKYIRPFEVHRKILPWTYEMKDIEGRPVQGSWNIKDLKAYPPDTSVALSL